MEYPGLYVNEKTGAIALSPELDLWSIIPMLLNDGIDHVMTEYEIEKLTGLDRYQFGYIMRGVLFHLFDTRHEFARLALTLANIERETDDENPWLDDPDKRSRMKKCLQDCLIVIEEKDQQSQTEDLH